MKIGHQPLPMGRVFLIKWGQRIPREPSLLPSDSDDGAKDEGEPPAIPAFLPEDLARIHAALKIRKDAKR